MVALLAKATAMIFSFIIGIVSVLIGIHLVKKNPKSVLGFLLAMFGSYKLFSIVLPKTIVFVIMVLFLIIFLIKRFKKTKKEPEEQRVSLPTRTDNPVKRTIPSQQVKRSDSEVKESTKGLDW